MSKPDLDRLATEARNPDTEDLDRLSPLELVRAMNREDRRMLEAVAGQAEAVARAVEAVAERMGRGGRLVYLGAGTSGRLGVLDAVECRPTFSAPEGLVVGLIAGGEAALQRSVEGAEDDAAAGADDLRALDLTAEDSVVGISASGRAPYVVGGLEFARRAGALTVAVSCNDGAEVAGVADVAITPVVGPEVLAGSTRLKAGTATKLVLNMLSTGVMVRLGKCYGNLMVDLQATNEKLRARALRIVRLATGLAATPAADLLARCGGEVKTAIVCHLRGLSPDAARADLAARGGRIRWND